MFNYEARVIFVHLQTSDEKFLTQLNEDTSIVDHAHYQSRKKRGFETDKTMEAEDFRIVHYAGPVTYYSENFIAKNKDTLFVVRILFARAATTIRSNYHKHLGRVQPRLIVCA